MDTATARSRRGPLRHRLGALLERNAGLPRRLIPIAAFLLGVTLGAVGFVGVWRHAASRGDEAQAARSASNRRLRHALDELARLRHTVAAERALVVRAHAARADLARRLAERERVDRGVAERLPAQLSDLGTSAAALARRSASLSSALASLQSYVAASGGSTLDPGFLGAQIRYLTGVSRAGEASAARLKDQVTAAAGTAASLGPTG